MADNELDTKINVKTNWPHPNCFVCGSGNLRGLRLAFKRQADGSVTVETCCGSDLEGYPGIVHGGVISALLDGGMTNCLFAHDLQAVTAELKIRYRHQVVIDKPIQVRAWIDQASPHLHVMKAELIQEGQVRCIATGKFVEINR